MHTRSRIQKEDYLMAFSYAFSLIMLINDLLRNAIILSGVARSTGRNPPPLRKGKGCCRKMMLFPKALLLRTTFPKIVKNSIFLLNFYPKFSKTSQNFSTISVFRPNTGKINSWFATLTEIYATNIF